MKELALAAIKRGEHGKGPARRARAEGYIPAVVYGPETDPISVSVSAKELRNTMKGTTGTAIINLDIAGSANKVIIRDVQRDPVTSKIVHLDFHAISANKPIQVSVPIHFEGIPIGVKTDGGIMQVVMHDVEILCLPADIPETINIDVSELSIGESIHVRDLDLPNTKMLSAEQRTIVVIAAPTVIKSDDVEAAAAAGEEGEAVEGAEGAEAAEGAEGAAPAAEEDKKDKKEKKS